MLLCSGENLAAPHLWWGDQSKMGFWRCEKSPPSQGDGCVIAKSALSLEVFVPCVMPGTGLCAGQAGGSKQGGGFSQAVQGCMYQQPSSALPLVFLFCCVSRISFIYIYYFFFK